MKKLLKSKNGFIEIKREALKAIMGGVLESPIVTSCTVYCDTEAKTKDCGEGIPCVTNGTEVTCGNNAPVDLCKKQ